MRTSLHPYRLVLAAVLAVIACSVAPAVDWPKGPVTIIAPSGAGGGTDLSARVFAKHVRDYLGVSAVVMNVPGGGNYNGIKKAHDSAPDGNTILFSHNNVIVNYVTGIAKYSIDGFEVGPRVVSDSGVGIFVNSSSKWKTLKEFFDEVRARPGEINTACEIGAYAHFLALAIEKQLGLDFKIVDVGNNAQKATALLGGHIDSMSNSYGTVQGYVQSGDFRCLGFVSKGRNSVFPDVPTFKEQGFDFVHPGYEFCFFFPKGTPKEICDKFEAAAKKVAESEAYKKDIEKLGFEAVFMTSADNLADYQKMEEMYKALAASIKK